MLLDSEAEEFDLLCESKGGEAAANGHGVLTPFADGSAKDSPCFGDSGGRCVEAGSAAATRPSPHVATALGHQ